MPSGVYKHKPQSGFQKGDKHWKWSGDDISYHGLHSWLKITFGKATKCENPKCNNPKPYRYEYALIKGKKYERKRENFWMLCRKCHMYYDGLIIAGWNKGIKTK